MSSKLESSSLSHRFSVAPMLNRTDRHCRYFMRLLSNRAILYTEMVTTDAIIYGNIDYLIYNKEEHPIALQLGGNNPTALAYCAKLAEELGYDEINFNVGCPSPRAQKGTFGVCLMYNPQLVADCIKAMRDVVSIPVTIKTRLGVEDQDSYKFLYNFISTISEKSGCEIFIIHARKAFLSLNSKENCNTPPLDYQSVYRLRQDFPHLTISINGGIQSLIEAKKHLLYVNGVMIGRAVYKKPSMLMSVDHEIFGANPSYYDLTDVVRSMYPYIERELSNGTHLNHITRHMLGLFQGIPGARWWRRYLSENAHLAGSNIKVLERALRFIFNKN